MTILTVEDTNCKDCHRCIRTCPVKAISLVMGHVKQVEDRCVLCGRCVVECPQHAKQVFNQISIVEAAIDSGKKIIMSFAPSFVNAFPGFTVSQLAGTLKSKGIYAIEETAKGAERVASTYRSMYQNADKPLISSCCPVVVNIIEIYYPELLDNLAPIASPMSVHGRMLKSKYGKDVFIVFVGPCLAKVAEGAGEKSIDAVLTFVQLREWLKQDLPNTEINFTVQANKQARMFPLPGGTLKSFLDGNDTGTSAVAVDGISNCLEVFEALVSGEISPGFIEALACSGGCVSGPMCGSANSKAAKQIRVINYTKTWAEHDGVEQATSEFLSIDRIFTDRSVVEKTPTDLQIKKILRQTNKFHSDDEKNCGACGYNTCREKAIAVHKGLAEIDMCVPYMRSKAELFASIIVDNTLDAVIVIDNKLIIQEFNPAAEKMFDRKAEEVCGTNLTEIMECASFVEAFRTGKKIAGRRVESRMLGLITEQTIVPVPDHGVIVGIIKNITAREERVRELEYVKLETIGKATEIINKQMHVAQEIAGLLGETAAETKATLLELIWLIKGKGDS